VAGELLENWRDGRIKLYVTHAILMLRGRRSELFRDGGYTPLLPDGELADHVVGFARQMGDQGALVAVPRLPHTFRKARNGEVWSGESWGEATLGVPSGMRGWTMRNVLTGREVTLSGSDLEVGGLFEGFPVAVLERID
jgi:(1->4)-alpha-D-glucan 1-alpha-D-glucosylmutase